MRYGDRKSEKCFQVKIENIQEHVIFFRPSITSVTRKSENY